MSRALVPRQLADRRRRALLGGRSGIESRESVPQPPLQHDDAVVGALLAGRIRRDVGPVRGLPAEGAEPLKRGVLNIGFGERGHGELMPAVAMSDPKGSKSDRAHARESASSIKSFKTARSYSEQDWNPRPLAIAASAPVSRIG